MNSVGALCSLLLTCSLSACSGYEAFKPEGLLVSPAEGQALNALVTKRTDATRSLRALSHSTIASGDEKSRLRHVIAAQPPAQFRLEALAEQAAYSFSLLTLDNDTATFVDFNEKTFRQGKANSGLLREALRLPISEQDLMWLSMGILPPHLWSPEVFVYHNELASTYSVLGGAQSFLAEYSGPENKLTGVKLRNPSDDYIEVVIAYEYTVDSITPSRIEIGLARYDVTVTMQLESAKINQELSSKLFTVVVPASFQRLD